MDGGGGPAPRVPARSSNPPGTSPPAHAGPAGHRRPARRHAGPVARPGATCRPRHCASLAGTRAMDPGSVSRPCPRGSAPSASRTLSGRCLRLQHEVAPFSLTQLVAPLSMQPGVKRVGARGQVEPDRCITLAPPPKPGRRREHQKPWGSSGCGSE